MIIDKYITPYKLQRPLIIGSGKEGAFDKEAVDCPFIFRHRNRFYMTYVGYDGVGYQTAIAVSDNLIDWTPLGVILGKKDDDSWDSTGIAGTWIIKYDDSLFGLNEIKKVKGRYWLAYQAYPGEGYEYGAGEIGLAWTEDEELLEWNTLPEPVLRCKDGEPWESGGLYKACIVENDNKFYLFYNAKNRTFNGWIEQTGFAVSEDLLNWERHAENPVMKVNSGTWESIFCCDPTVYRDDDNWVMFYYGFDGKHAQNGIAFSKDLEKWTKHPEPILKTGHKGEIDEKHAHKPSLIYHDGTLYHFYCACRPSRETDRAKIFGNEFRCITVASSKPFDF
jgi:predicted GH43/DUF377 family glycosyl hydrolase